MPISTRNNQVLSDQNALPKEPANSPPRFQPLRVRPNQQVRIPDRFHLHGLSLDLTVPTDPDGTLRQATYTFDPPIECPAASQITCRFQDFTQRRITYGLKIRPGPISHEWQLSIVNFYHTPQTTHYWPTRTTITRFEDGINMTAVTASNPVQARSNDQGANPGGSNNAWQFCSKITPSPYILVWDFRILVLDYLRCSK